MNEPALKYDLEFSMVHQELLDKCWDECEKILKRSVKRSNGRVTIDDIYRDIDSGKCQLWIVYNVHDLKIIGCSVTRHGFWNWVKNKGWRRHATFYEYRISEDI